MKLCCENGRERETCSQWRRFSKNVFSLWERYATASLNWPVKGVRRMFSRMMDEEIERIKSAWKLMRTSHCQRAIGPLWQPLEWGKINTFFGTDLTFSSHFLMTSGNRTEDQDFHHCSPRDAWNPAGLCILILWPEHCDLDQGLAQCVAVQLEVSKSKTCKKGASKVSVR